MLAQDRVGLLLGLEVGCIEEPGLDYKEEIGHKEAQGIGYKEAQGIDYKEAQGIGWILLSVIFSTFHSKKNRKGVFLHPLLWMNFEIFEAVEVLHH